MAVETCATLLCPKGYLSLSAFQAHDPRLRWANESGLGATWTHAAPLSNVYTSVRPVYCVFFFCISSVFVLSILSPKRTPGSSNGESSLNVRLMNAIFNLPVARNASGSLATEPRPSRKRGGIRLTKWLVFSFPGNFYASRGVFPFSIVWLDSLGRLGK